LLLVLGAYAARHYEWRSLRRFARDAVRWDDASADAKRAGGTGFWFDHDYAAFLDAVRRATPPDATISVAVPARPPAYVYQAAFTLAPRRVVGLGLASAAPYVAYYRDETALSQPGSVRIPGGVLLRR
jgi:hypothetical protein